MLRVCQAWLLGLARCLGLPYGLLGPGALESAVDSSDFTKLVGFTLRMPAAGLSGTLRRSQAQRLGPGHSCVCTPLRRTRRHQPAAHPAGLPPRRSQAAEPSKVLFRIFWDCASIEVCFWCRERARRLYSSGSSRRSTGDLHRSGFVALPRPSAQERVDGSCCQHGAKTQICSHRRLAACLTPDELQAESTAV